MTVSLCCSARVDLVRGEQSCSACFEPCGVYPSLPADFEPVELAGDPEQDWPDLDAIDPTGFLTRPIGTAFAKPGGSPT